MIAEPPGTPPGPYVSFTAHAAANGFDFAVNRIAGGASVLPHNGLERPADCRFGPAGSLYVVDWGEMVPAPERGGVEIRLGTGILWRIRRTAGVGDHGEVPPKPLVLPVNLLRAVVPAAGVAGAALAVRAARRARRAKS